MKESLFHDRIPVQCNSQAVSSILTCDITYGYDEIVIRLIDTNDIFKFYQCVITGSSYNILRKEQELRVSFEEFLKKIVEMFHSVKRNIFKGLLDRDSLKFIFIEQNEFRNLIRLEIQLSLPDDNDYKKYLSEMIGNLEKTNVRLYKENIQLKENYKNVENDTYNRIKELSRKNNDLFQKNSNLEINLEKYEKENKTLEKEKELDSSRIIDLEKENNNLKYELDKAKIDLFKRDSEIKRFRTVEQEKSEIEEEIKTANEIIRKMREDTRKINKEKEEKGEICKEYEKERHKLQKQLEQSKKQIRDKEDRLKRLKDAHSAKDDRIRNLELEIKTLTKKMDDTKFVYSHFYRKNDNEQPGKYMDETSSVSEPNSNFNIEPESPPRSLK